MRRRFQRGAAIVESALVMVVFLAVLIFLFDCGQFLFLHQTHVERLRRAARYASVNPYDAATIQNMVLYGKPTAPEHPVASSSLNRTMITVARLDAGTKNERIVITMKNYKVAFISPMIARVAEGLPLSISVPYEAQM
jgi:Flp pilus assembly protein TadG